jgi:putative transposase
MKYPTHYPQFFTATILEWKHLLKPDKYKDIIINSLSFLATKKLVKIFAFVIMKNHLHIIWQTQAENSPSKIQASFMKFTAQQIKFDLLKYHPEVLEKFKVNAADREYQFWERNSLSIDLHNNEVFIQKIEYIHYNPVKAGLCINPEDYKYSSAKFYETGVDEFGFLTHINE